MSADYTEQRFDYSGAQSKAPELILMIGISGSGKSTLAKEWVKRGQGKVVRVNRDSYRSMLFADLPWTKHQEKLVRALEQQAVWTALKEGRSVIVDDTNCVTKTREDWEKLAREGRFNLRIVTMTTPTQECIERDAKRQGKESVGKGVILQQQANLDASAVIETRAVRDREALLRKEWTVRLPDAKWVFVDMDGTLANHEGVRSPFDESRVHLDNPYPVVVEWVRSIWWDYNVCIVSGRKEKSGDFTCDWLDTQQAPFDHILMRHTNDNRKDSIVKQEILDEFLQAFKKEDIAFVIDDRPSVVRMWKENGLTVYPVRGAVEEF